MTSSSARSAAPPTSSGRPASPASTPSEVGQSSASAPAELLISPPAAGTHRPTASPPPSEAGDSSHGTHYEGFGAFMAGQLGLDANADESVDADEELSRDTALRRSGVYNFLQVPWNLEPMLLFGYVTCLDCFLQLVTFLPLRMVGAGWGLFVRRRRLTVDQSRDALRGVMVAAVSYMLLQIDMSQAYHMVRGHRPRARGRPARPRPPPLARCATRRCSSCT